MGLTGSVCGVVCPSRGLLVIPRPRSMRGRASSPVLLRALLGTPEPPWEAQRGHGDFAAQLFWMTLAAGRASKPSLNERLEVSESHGRLSLANHPRSSPPSSSRSPARRVSWPPAGWCVARRAGLLGRFCLAADSACCEMVESGGADLRKGLAMSTGKCESRGFQL